MRAERGYVRSGQARLPPRSRRQDQAQVRETRSHCIQGSATARAVVRSWITLSDGPFRDRLRRPHAVRQARRLARRLPGDRARRDRDPRRARPRRASRTTRSSTRSWARCSRAAPARRPRARRRSAPGCRSSCPSDTINKVCASSIRAVEIADQMIRAGDHDVVVAGGMESMSNAPYVLKKARFGYRLGDGTLIDLMTHDGLTSTFDSRHMVEQASFVSRGARDLAGGAGPLGAALARARGDGDRRRAASQTRSCPSATSRWTRRRGATRRSRSSRALKPVFDPEGTTTAGNAPGVNDGAGALVVTSEEFARKRGLEVLATIVAQGYVADEFAYLARTPAKAGADRAREGRQVDRRRRAGRGERGVLARSRSTRRRCSAPIRRRVNVNGGAVALGHPIGASGARILGDDDLRAAPQRRRARARRDLLRRRPGRRAAARGLASSGAVLTRNVTRSASRSSSWTGPAVASACEVRARPRRRRGPDGRRDRAGRRRLRAAGVAATTRRRARSSAGSRRCARASTQAGREGRGRPRRGARDGSSRSTTSSRPT